MGSFVSGNQISKCDNDTSFSCLVLNLGMCIFVIPTIFQQFQQSMQIIYDYVGNLILNHLCTLTCNIFVISNTLHSLLFCRNLKIKTSSIEKEASENFDDQNSNNIFRVKTCSIPSLHFVKAHLSLLQWM